MTFYAFVKDEDNMKADWKLINFEALSKADFINQIHSNGYIVRHNKAYTQKEKEEL